MSESCGVDPFIIKGSTIQVINRSVSEHCTIKFKLVSYQDLDPDAGEDLTEDRPDEIMNGEDSMQGLPEDEDDETAPKGKKGKGKVKKRKRGKKGKNGPKMRRCKEIYVLKGELCAGIFSPILKCTLKVKHRQREDAYDLVEILDVEVPEKVTISSIRNKVQRAGYFGQNDKPKPKKVEFGKIGEEPVGKTPQEKAYFRKLTRNTFKPLERVGHRDAELSPSMLSTIAMNGNDLAKNIFKNVNKPKKFFELLGKMGVEAAECLSADEVRLLGLGEYAEVPDNLRGLNPESVLIRVAFAKKIAPDGFELFENALVRARGEGSEDSARETVKNVREASAISHDLTKKCEAFYATCIYEDVKGAKWSEGALKVLGSFDPPRFSVYREPYKDRAVVQTAKLRSASDRLADALLRLETVESWNWEVDDYDCSHEEGGGYMEAVLGLIRDHDVFRDLDIVCGNARRKQWLKSNLNYKIRTVDEVRSMSSGTGAGALFVDRAHLIGMDDMATILEKYSGHLKNLYMNGSVYALPDNPGSWYRDLRSCRTMPKLRVTSPKLVPSARIAEPKYSVDSMDCTPEQVMSTAPKPSDIKIVAANREKEDEVREYMGSYVDSGITITTVHKLSYESPPHRSTVIYLPGMDSSGIAKCSQCSYSTKNAISFIGGTEALSLALVKPRHRTGNFNYVVTNAIVRSLTSDDSGGIRTSGMNDFSVGSTSEDDDSILYESYRPLSTGITDTESTSSLDPVTASEGEVEVPPNPEEDVRDSNEDEEEGEVNLDGDREEEEETKDLDESDEESEEEEPKAETRVRPSLKRLKRGGDGNVSDTQLDDVLSDSVND
jgi:hypothetical protein